MIRFALNVAAAMFVLSVLMMFSMAIVDAMG